MELHHREMTNEEEELVAVVQASKLQSSIKITIPKRVASELDVAHGSFIGFFKRKGDFFIKLIK